MPQCHMPKRTGVSIDYRDESITVYLACGHTYARAYKTPPYKGPLVDLAVLARYEGQLIGKRQRCEECWVICLRVNTQQCIGRQKSNSGISFRA
jgi:hypothetical protein